MGNPVEQWKAEKHGFDVWADVLRYAEARTPMKDIPQTDLERMKYHGVFYRKRDTPGSYMLRIRITGCELNSDQARAIAFVAYEYGYGIVDITTRANIQVQGLAIEDVPDALARLTAVGLTAKQTGHDNVRNVYGHPLAGLAANELIDTRDLCRRITSIFLDSRIYSDLPRKFNIALCGHSEHGIHYWTQDVSFLACPDYDGRPAFAVLVGGKQGQSPRLGSVLPVLLRPSQVIPVTQALLDLFREEGPREKRDECRFRVLLDRIGIRGVLDCLEQRLDFPLTPFAGEPSSPAGYEDLIGWFPQKQTGRWTMGACVPLGRLTWQQLEGLAVAAKRWGDGSLRTTPEQGLMVANIPTAFRDALATEAARFGLSIHSDTLARNMVACTGKQFCNIAVTETKGHAYGLMEKLRQRGVTLHGIRIHMSGCPASCALHHTADIGLKGVRVKRLLGTREGFDVFLGGGVAGRLHLGIPYKLGVDVDQLPQVIEEVVCEYYLLHKPGETFSAYWREKLRETEPAKVGDADYIAPIWVCENCEYRHEGEDPPVYCPKCAALRRNFARLEDESASGDEEADAPRTDGYRFAIPADALVEGRGAAVVIAGKEVALFRVGDEVYAIDGQCPHLGGALADGRIESGTVTCPLHGWQFDVCSGCRIDSEFGDVARYPVLVEDGRIYVHPTPRPAAAGRPLPAGSPF